ncbi:1,3-beta-glucan synthase [Synchytrium microbalum]|uniref:1,3-beta-glucan synthase n=1 Tax=Synchytrium microbalum TaxID=1806994 RepID=A0A507CB95_9FUNG|nr:1,3-beta-glucan synthase [Synchytrium microbalum]TPX36628.1 1,3-beta-glucan synthase [Synchytrium microbalum]
MEPDPKPSSQSQIDLLAPIRSMRKDSRYSFTAPSADSVMTSMDKLQSRHARITSATNMSNASSSTGVGSSSPSTSSSPPTNIPVLRPDGGLGVDLDGIFTSLTRVFGFQGDSVANVREYLMSMLDSRASRMGYENAVKSVHADYIGGENANYKRWYLSSSLEHEPVSNSDQNRPASRLIWGSHVSLETSTLSSYALDLEDQTPEQIAELAWRRHMRSMSQEERCRQLALWLLIWGEAASIRLIPEALCFLFKLADDFSSNSATTVEFPPGTFLNEVIKPLYDFLRNQTYKFVDAKMVKKEKDHDRIIGYDDMNETFWSRDGINRLILKDGKTRLLDLPAGERYVSLKDVDWKRTFRKTFYERRSVLHVLVNFGRVWILHLGLFLFFLTFAAGPLYSPSLQDSTTDPSSSLSPDGLSSMDQTDDGLDVTDLHPEVFRWAVTGFVGGVGVVLFSLFSTIVEASFLPWRLKFFKIFGRRFGFLMVLLVANIIPLPYVLLITHQDSIAATLAAVQVIIAVATFIYLVCTPPSNLFVSSTRQSLQPTNTTFTANFAPLKPTERAMSLMLWACIFTCKLIESLLFLMLPASKPMRELASIPWEECGDKALWCRGLVYLTLALLVVLLLILSFLDSYMWWILFSTIFGAIRAFCSGLSILAPWRNIFSRLPDRIYTKVFATSEMRYRVKPILLCSQLWNAIVTSMFEDHLISIENLDKLLYRQYPMENNPKTTRIEKPKFFISQEDISTKTEFFPKGSEAERRFTFFAQSLSMVFPEPTSVHRMPSFSVLTPHFSEKILLPLKEIVMEQDPSSSVTLLEYLQSLHPFEWQNFVKDTKMWIAENPSRHADIDVFHDHDYKDKVDDIPFQTFGFRDSNPEGILRTRIWASLRSQTLYRTVSGFMNYANALKLLLRIENSSELMASVGSNPSDIEKEIDRIVASKFSFVLAMQRFVHFTNDEQADVKLMLKIYPGLKIAYIDEVVDETVEDGGKRYYSALIDGFCQVNENGRRVPKYRIELPGSIILGDGKSDNQNHSIIFTRGEVVQLIDSNQDQYIEGPVQHVLNSKCLKIRSVLAEFEPPVATQYSSPPPVAIVGAREHIFSARIGVLGDVAACREQTFGTIAQRVSAKLGARLHYGHPDFLNSIFMTTRGGVSKAQRGLHVNEDVFTGMTALQRGGRIKHTEYMQCGKGRDLGFASILKFVAKIGGGMAEQLLSREHYYLGSRLALHRLLTFFYAHTGFHMNNVFIMLSIQLFLIFMACLAALSLTFTLCSADGTTPSSSLSPDDSDGGSLADGTSPTTCINLESTLTWTRQAVFAIVVVFALNFLPLFTQLLTEVGILPAITRLCKHVMSLSPLFDVFTTQMYAHTLLYDLIYGRAGYIASGRGFATARASFSSLFQAFADPSLYFGIRLFLILCLITATLNLGGYLAFFWLMVLPLCISPFLFNPHQFRLKDFILDFMNTLRWLGSGNVRSTSDSWVAFHARQRVQMIGNTRTRGTQSGLNRARWSAIFWQDIISPIVTAAIFICAYAVAGKSIMRILAVSLLPCLLNAGLLFALFPLSCILGPLVAMCSEGCLPMTLANIAHGWAVVTLLLAMVIQGLLGGDLALLLLGLVVVLLVQRALFRIVTVTLITREIHHGGASLAWWSGAWYSNNLGYRAIILPAREFIVKVLELSSFAADFWVIMLLHFLMLPICLIPYVDRLHLLMLLWTLPKQTSAAFPVVTASQKSRRKWSLCCGCLVLAILFVVFVVIFIAPVLAASSMGPNFMNKFKLPI